MSNDAPDAASSEDTAPPGSAAIPSGSGPTGGAHTGDGHPRPRMGTSTDDEGLLRSQVEGSVDGRPAAASVPASRLGAGVITRYAIGSIGTGGFATLPGLVLTYYLTDSLGVAALVAGVVIAAAKIWDVIIDPVVGALSDRDRARHGSRRRFMLIGACTIPVFFALTFAAPPAIGPVLGALWVLIAFLLTATSFSLFQVPYIALPAELTPGYDERTRLLTWRVVVLTLAILLFGAGGPALRRVTGDPVTGYLLMGVVSGVVLAIGMLVATSVARRAVDRADVVSTRASGARSTIRKEAGAHPTAEEASGARSAAEEAGSARSPAEEAGGARATLGEERAGIRAHYAAGIAVLRRSAPFRTLLSAYLLQALATGLMLAGAQYVATWVMQSEAAVELLFVVLIAPAFVAAPVWGIVAARIGKERAFAIASVLFAVAALSLLGLQWSAGDWAYVPVGIAGVAYAGMQSLPMAMLPDVISHDERANGPGRAGAFSGVWTAGETIGFALGATVLSIVLAITGYISSTTATQVVQPDAAVTGIVVSFSVLPAALIALSLVALARYRLRRADIDALHQHHPDGTASQPE